MCWFLGFSLCLRLLWQNAQLPFLAFPQSISIHLASFPSPPPVTSTTFEAHQTQETAHFSLHVYFSSCIACLPSSCVHRSNEFSIVKNKPTWPVGPTCSLRLKPQIKEFDLAQDWNLQSDNLLSVSVAMSALNALILIILIPLIRTAGLSSFDFGVCLYTRRFWKKSSFCRCLSFSTIVSIRPLSTKKWIHAVNLLELNYLRRAIFVKTLLSGKQTRSGITTLPLSWLKFISRLPSD